MNQRFFALTAITLLACGARAYAMESPLDSIEPIARPAIMTTPEPVEITVYNDNQQQKHMVIHDRLTHSIKPNTVTWEAEKPSSHE